MPCFREGMIEHVMGADNYELALRMLDAAALRHQALATNLANIETPGFKRLDLAPDFDQQLAAYSSDPGQEMLDRIQPVLAPDLARKSSRADGNNVELEHEMIEMGRNALEYDFLTQYASDSLKRLKTAITGNVQ